MLLGLLVVVLLPRLRLLFLFVFLFFVLFGIVLLGLQLGHDQGGNEATIDNIPIFEVLEINNLRGSLFLLPLLGASQIQH